jgi:hypothetical protein
MLCSFQIVLHDCRLHFFGEKRIFTLPADVILKDVVRSFSRNIMKDVVALSISE